MAHDVPEKVLESLDESRRSFVKKMILTTPFVVPTVASFAMSGLSSSEAFAAAPNQVAVPAVSPIGLGAAAAALLLSGAALLRRGLGRGPRKGDADEEKQDE